MHLYTLLLLALALPSPATAGRITNNTPWTARYTTDATTSSGPPNLCAFWNWQNASPHAKTVHCTQRTLAAHTSYSASSLDGFTFADREYHSDGGRGQTRGVWTKVGGSQTYQCKSSGGSDPYPQCDLFP
ncbi:hypothetical protein MMC30_009402 [Trapelia coarctata]|nr:hypothetical protein [Trapelia coarctata]